MKRIEEQIKKATDICQEIEMLVASTKEDIKDSKSMTEVWNKVDDLQRDIEQLKLKQTATGRTKQTNADRIRAMSDDELVNFIIKGCWGEKNAKLSYTETLEWLKQEAKDE